VLCLLTVTIYDLISFVVPGTHAKLARVVDRWAEDHERAARGDPALSPDQFRDPRYRRHEARLGVNMHHKWEGLLDKGVPVTTGGTPRDPNRRHRLAALSSPPRRHLPPVTSPF